MEQITDDVVMLVASQSGVHNRDQIVRALEKHNGRIVDTICELGGFPDQSDQHADPSLMSDVQQSIMEVRKIVDEKEAFFHNLMKQTKQEQMGLK
jgi:hypothetical protein